MPEILVLDDNTIDKIAAGEVVERPSSVVKELVENALDAGAGAVTVEIRDGGCSFIRITDNGEGIAKEQVRKAFFRHATSKIRSVEDLSRIHSLGFRGEALSSIASVSMVELITKTKDSLSGVRYCLEGGKERDFSEIGAPDGTTMIIRELFFNTPARKKFLKSNSAEGSSVSDLMEHLALCRPDTAFQFIQNGQVRFHTSGNGDLKEIIYRIYGRDIVKELIPVHVQENGITLEGYLGSPVIVRANRGFEFFFLNGRYIRSSLLSKGLEAGYRAYLMQHKFPFALIHMSVDPQQVDVNVHPAKMEVRFDNQQAIHQFMEEHVADCLKKREMIPSVQLDTVKKKSSALPASVRGELKEEGDRNTSAAVTAVPSVSAESSLAAERIRNISASADKRPGGSVPSAAASAEVPVCQTADGAAGPVSLPVVDTPELVSSPAVNILEPVSLPAAYAAESLSSSAAHASDSVTVAAISVEEPAAQNIPQGTVRREKPEAVQPFETRRLTRVLREEEETYALAATQQHEAEEGQMNLFEERILSENAVSRYRILGQVFDTYWLAEYDGQLLFIDQHAAHEKVRYEALIRRVREGSADSQMLLVPMVLNLSAKEAHMMELYLTYFAALGFEIEPFGENTYAVRSVPCDLFGHCEKELLLTILDELEEDTLRKTPAVIEEKLASMACKSAVKGNHAMSAAEMEALFSQLLKLENPYHCPHGRPTVITMSRYELEKKFKRII